LSGADWRHVDDLSLDQLHPGIRRQDTGLCHALIFLDGDEMATRPLIGGSVHNVPNTFIWLTAM
jgi:hypothetical protein